LANPAPENAVLKYVDDTEPANMVPFCWNCHGGGTIMKFNNTTSVVHGNGTPVMYGD
jgi:hypothetical protein